MTLVEIVPALWRKRVYISYWVLGAVTTLAQAGVAAYAHGQPDLLTVWLAVYTALGTLVGATAASNVTVPDPVVSDEG